MITASHSLWTILLESEVTILESENPENLFFDLKLWLGYLIRPIEHGADIVGTYPNLFFTFLSLRSLFLVG